MNPMRTAKFTFFQMLRCRTFRVFVSMLSFYTLCDLRRWSCFFWYWSWNICAEITHQLSSFYSAFPSRETFCSMCAVLCSEYYRAHVPCHIPFCM